MYLNNITCVMDLTLLVHYLGIGYFNRHELLIPMHLGPTRSKVLSCRRPLLGLCRCQT